MASPQKTITAPAGHPAVPAAVLAKLRAICLDLPEALEEVAWVGTRWTVRKKNFAHVLMINAAWPPAYARVAGLAGPACVLTFRVPRRAIGAPRFTHLPFFLPGWWPDIVGLVLDTEVDGVDWEEVEKLLTASYCALAPKKLAALVDRP